MKDNYDKPDREEMVTVATYAHAWEAHVAAGVLDSEGIPSMLTNELFSSVYPIGFNSIGEVGLMVFSRDLERARDLLSHCSSSGI